MKTSINAIALAGFAVASLFVSGCATRFKPESSYNPPPAENFSNFTAFEIMPVGIAPKYADSGANQKALAKIQEHVGVNILPLLDTWNQNGANKGGPARTLVIAPTVTDIKFISGFARVMVGPLAGSSAVILDVTITEKETGKVIATPEFYEVAKAQTGAWTFGAADNLMLVNIANRVTEYLIKNYPAAIGGPSGAP